MSPEVQAVLDHLRSLNVKFTYKEHPAVHTIAEMAVLGLEGEEQVAKNLFLKDGKKKNYFLVTLDQRKTADLKALSAALGVKGLSFASEDDLMKYLRLERGAVTPLGVLNDQNRAVTVVMDTAVLAFDTVGVHPNVNTASVWLSPDELVRVVQEHGSSLIIMDI